MSERHWSRTAANLLIGSSIFLLSLAWVGDIILNGWDTVHKSNAAYQKNAEYDRDKSADEIAETCKDLAVVEFRHCIRENLETHYRDQTTNEDLQAQQDMAYWAFWLLIASTAGIMIRGFGVLLLIRSIKLGQIANGEATKAVKAAHDTVEITREIGQKQTRAYLTGLHVKVSWGKTPIGLEILMKNTGNTPTKGVKTSSRMTTRGNFMAFNDIPETKIVNLDGSDVPAQSEQTIFSKIDRTGNEGFFRDYAASYSDGLCTARFIVSVRWTDVFGEQDQCRMFFDVPIEREKFGETDESIEYFGLSRTEY